MFENAIVDTCILLAQKAPSSGSLQAVSCKQDFQKGDHIRHYAEQRAVLIPANELSGEAWCIGNPTEQAVRHKMQTIGTPLKEWDVKINFGIKTGLNEAFIIDDSAKRALVAADPKSAEIIKPVLRGRDIRRYQANWAKLWLIDAHNGYGKVPAIDMDDYPAVKHWLDKSYPQLAKRQDQGQTPYNLRHCAYHQLFDEEKIVWPQLVRIAKDDVEEKDFPRFSLAREYTLAGAPIITGKSLKYLAALLNSNCAKRYFKSIVPVLDNGGYQISQQYIETIPIPKIPEESQRPFVDLVNRILKTKATSPSADTSKLEKEIDRLVYQLYNLTADEISAIEKAPK